MGRAVQPAPKHRGTLALVEAVQSGGGRPGHPAGCTDIQDEIREVADRGMRCEHAPIGAHSGTIEGAAVDSAPKLAIAQPCRSGLVSGERSELTFCHRTKAVEPGHRPDSIVAGRDQQLVLVYVSTQNRGRSIG